jgi:molybdate-binding protein/transcriptional regulator with XRE-family HTH domain
MIVSEPNPLSQHRLRRGWSQAALADQSGVSRTEISAIETGRLVPSVAVALRLASALGESVETLFHTTPAQSAPAHAWSATDEDARVWRATINGKVVIYPVESTAAGMLPHDGIATANGIDVVTPDARPDRTLVIAGCDPLVGLLVSEMAEQHGMRVIPVLRSSTQALELLKQGLVHVAGLHLTDDDGKTANDRVVLDRLGAGFTLLHQLRWDAGIAVAPGRRERSVRDLLKANVRWVNREEGSAARYAFDRLLDRRQRPKGYRHIVRDHRAVAATVSSGWAEAGICIRPASMEERLGFISLQREAYELCVAERALADSRVAALITTLRSRRYRQLVADVPGCASNEAGDQRSVA